MADAAAEQPLEKAWLACTDHDQLGVTLLGGVDELLRWLTGDGVEFDVQVRIGERVGRRVRREAGFASWPLFGVDTREPVARRGADPREPSLGHQRRGQVQ